MLIRVAKLIILALLGSGLLVTVPAPAANAVGGTFDWTFEGKCCINTRQFTTTKEADIYFKITSVSPCDNWEGSTYGYPKIEVALYQSDWGSDTHIGSDKTIENCSGTKKWSMVNARKDLYFKIKILYPHRDSKTYTIKGKVAYDGATL